LQQGISTSPDTLLQDWTRLDAMLKDTPLVEVIEAARVTALPDFHPEAGPTFAGFPVNAFVIHHPAGPIIVDTGIGTGNEHIDDWYRPIVCDLRAELAQRDIDPDSGLTIVNTHLHFDHCGQNQNFPSASIYAQQAEIDLLASDAHYTVAAWANMPLNRSTIIDGDQEIADGVSVLHTPGHTPGHQSVAYDPATKPSSSPDNAYGPQAIGKRQTYDRRTFTTTPAPNKQPTASRSSKHFDQPEYTSRTTST
jgi:glyoxylase-like metal-dependent hydrolase (beta-lactamase superfamily II)